MAYKRLYVGSSMHDTMHAIDYRPTSPEGKEIGSVQQVEVREYENAGPPSQRKVKSKIIDVPDIKKPNCLVCAVSKSTFIFA